MRTRWPWLGSGLAGAVLFGAVVASLATAAAPSPSPSPSPSPIPQGCQLRSPQPQDPLELNIVAVGRSLKAIAMEKEIFNCYDAQGTLDRIRDVETFIEIVGQSRPGPNVQGNTGPNGKEKGHAHRPKPPHVATVRTTVEEVACTKGLRTGRVACGSTGVPLARTETPLTRCSPTSSTYPFPAVPQPADPVEMDTVVVGGLVTTIKVEKEIFDCAGQIGDLYIFTQIVEAKRGSSFRTVSRRFSGVICFKNEVRAQLAQCKVFTPTRT